MFCGGSLIANNGFKLGSTSDANWDGDNMWEIAKTFGRIYGSKCVSFISSRREGSIFRVRRPSENLSRTPARPFMNEIFSSRDFAAKFERSRKFSVDIGREEKNACDGSVVGEGRFCGCLVMRAFKTSEIVCESGRYQE